MGTGDDTDGDDVGIVAMFVVGVSEDSRWGDPVCNSSDGSSASESEAESEEVEAVDEEEDEPMKEREVLY